MTKTACGLCGADPARGEAAINDTPYCHDDIVYPSCYELVSWRNEKS